MKSNESSVLSNAARQKRYRERNKVTDSVTRVTDKVTEGVTDNISLNATIDPPDPTPNLELCRTCGELLPPLERPRKYPGKCLKCVTGKVEVVEGSVVCSEKS